MLLIIAKTMYYDTHDTIHAWVRCVNNDNNDNIIMHTILQLINVL